MLLVNFRARFLTEFADSVNFLSQGSPPRGLVYFSEKGFSPFLGAPNMHGHGTFMMYDWGSFSFHFLSGRTKEGGQSQKKKVEKPQDGRQKSGQNIGNPYQMEDNKAAPSAPPPWGSCCHPFGKDFLCFCTIFGAPSGSRNNFFTRRAGKIL